MSNNNIIFQGKTEAIYKIIVIGDPATGKTELIAKFATNQFEEKYLPTVGVSILKQPIELKAYNATVNIMFWDIAGQPQFYMLHRPYFNGADGMVLVFDLTRSSTFRNIINWYNSALKYGLSDIPRILIGNKAHLTEERKIILPMAKHLAEKLNASYYETSPLSGVNFKEAFEKIAELAYRSKKSNDTWNSEPLTFKAYEGPTQPSSYESDSMKRYDNRKKAIETPYYYRSKEKPTQTLSQSKLNKKEKKAIETTFRFFNESKAVYYKPEKTETELLNAIKTGNLVILTSKWKYPKILDFIVGFVIIFMIWLFLLAISSGVIVKIIATVILIGYTGRFITFAIYFRHYYILLDSQGIYFKKIGPPKFISWSDVISISGYFQGYAFSNLHHDERAIGLVLKSKKIVRFKEINYQFKDKFPAFDYIFWAFKFRRCPFLHYGRHRGEFFYD